ncbi:MAG: prepilin peptidase [Chloroflexota bacterium]
MDPWISRIAVAVIVVIAVVMDVRKMRLRRWLTIGGLVAGLAFSTLAGWQGLADSVLGAAGSLVLVPLVVFGGFGVGDALLVAAIGAWEGWPAIVWVLWRAALVGGLLGVVAWRMRKRAFPYVPAIAISAITTVLP